MNQKIKNLAKQFKKKISEVYEDRLSAVILFGSHARGDAKEDSDIDFLIILKGKVKPFVETMKISNLRFDFSNDFDKVISCIFTSEEKYLNEKSPLFLNIQKEGVTI